MSCCQVVAATGLLVLVVVLLCHSCWMRSSCCQVYSGTVVGCSVVVVVGCSIVVVGYVLVAVKCEDELLLLVVVLLLEVFLLLSSIQQFCFCCWL